MEIAFIGLNILDAYLTKMALATGASELNPLVVFGSNMIFKGHLATAIVIGLYFWGKEKLLPLLCLGMFGVCLWNLAVCFLLKVGGGA